MAYFASFFHIHETQSFIYMYTPYQLLQNVRVNIVEEPFWGTQCRKLKNDAYSGFGMSPCTCWVRVLHLANVVAALGPRNVYKCHLRNKRSRQLCQAVVVRKLAFKE